MFWLRRLAPMNSLCRNMAKCVADAKRRSRVIPGEQLQAKIEYLEKYSADRKPPSRNDLQNEQTSNGSTNDMTIYA